jgi:tetratricopeptide (TPR) repeat protein
MGQLLQDEGRLDEAAGHLEFVLSRVPARRDALFRLAQLREAQGRSEEAAALLARQQVIYPLGEEVAGIMAVVREGRDTPATWARLVELHRRLGEDDDAAQALQNGLARFPGAPELVALRGAPAAEPER